MRIKKVIRDIPAGDAQSTIDVDVIRKSDSATLDTVSTDASGIATYDVDGNPGPLLFEATVGAQTKRYDTQSDPALGMLTPIDLTTMFRDHGNGYVPGYADPVTTNGGMAVSPGSGLQVSVAEGKVVLDGSVYRCTSAKALAIAANSSGSTRYDRIIVRVTREGQGDTEGTCDLAVITGTADSAGPALTNDATTAEYSLAKLTVANGASSFTAGNIADERYSTTLNQAPAFRYPTGLRAGDLFYLNASGVLTRLPIGSEGNILNVASGIPAWTGAPSGVGAHTHSSFQSFDMYASRNAVASGGLSITSGTSQDVLSDTQSLSNGVTYDVYIRAGGQCSAGSGGTVEIAVDISGTTSGDLWSEVWLGTPTEGGERWIDVFGVARGVPGNQTITAKLVARRGTSNATIGSASLFGWVMPRGTGGVA